MQDIRDIFLEVIDIEQQELERLKSLVNDDAQKAVDIIQRAKGRVIISGIGKSGLIGRKIAATMSSTGTPSIFLHPVEALHGDLGTITADDVLICISYSGETDELLRIIPSLKGFGVPIIGITGKPNSTLGRNSDCVLNVNVSREACPLELAPTSSTTNTLVIGDALAVALMKVKGFQERDFAVFHPGGSLGRRLLCRVQDEMIADPLPTNNPADSMSQVIMTMTGGMVGLTVVVGPGKRILGIITDGDVRRSISTFGADFLNKSAQDIMTATPVLVGMDVLIHDAETMMQQQRVNSLLVHDNQTLVGILSQRKLKYGAL